MVHVQQVYKCDFGAVLLQILCFLIVVKVYGEKYCEMSLDFVVRYFCTSSCSTAVGDRGQVMSNIYIYI